VKSIAENGEYGFGEDDIPTLVLSLADDSTKPAFNFFAKACPSAVVTLLIHQPTSSTKKRGGHTALH
jgi:hypothetical protein